MQPVSAPNHRPLLAVRAGDLAAVPTRSPTLPLPPSHHHIPHLTIVPGPPQDSLPPLPSRPNDVCVCDSAVVPAFAMVQGFHHHHPDTAPQFPGGWHNDITTASSQQQHHQHHIPQPRSAAPAPPTLLPTLAPAPNPPPPAGGTEHIDTDLHRHHLRQWHNRIRKKYRTKLSTQFERLQALVVVPALDDDEQNAADGGRRVDGRSTRGMNKARVLELARRRIEELVREAEEMAREKGRLEGMMGGRAVRAGGEGGC
ncbi:hypothetical protein QBC39DRAFT_349974 [Podospora conica]|nr:hypothetical protein QBC39DRAFT_349974 [Schizothecium conicum]